MAVDNSYIERRIVIGMIVSTDFIKLVKPLWNTRLLESKVAKRLAVWCLSYYDRFDKAPGKDIESIFFNELRNGLPKELAEEIEEDLLPELSDEFLEEGLNLPYLTESAMTYFNERHLVLFTEQIQSTLLDATLTEQQRVIKAEQIASSYKLLATQTGMALNMADPEVIERVERAFEEAGEPLVRFPKALGEFWNHQLTRGKFVALMAIEKRGKTFWLLEFAIRAISQGRKVVFFQAGDMTEGDQLRRIAMYLAGRSDREKYTQAHYEPIRDCVWNQLDNCDRPVREGRFGPFASLSPNYLRQKMTYEKLLEAVQTNPQYKPCFNCKEYQTKAWGAVWLSQVPQTNPLMAGEASRLVKEFFVDKKRNFLLSTHANGTLSVSNMKALLSVWEKQSGFIPDVIIVDYADLLVAESRVEFRHQQNEIWKALRNLTQERHCLLITATQADANAYDREWLKMSNFSEDKRKYAHATAMFGLNQDPQGREKKLGIMRINELVIREGESNPMNAVWVLHNLRRGKPYLQSFF